MALSQKGASYPNRGHVRSQDPYLAEALDWLASQIQTVASQTSANPAGEVSAPNAPAALAVSVASGIFSATITDNGAAAGTAYLLEYSTTPNFQSPVTVDLGVSRTWSANLHGLTLYFRCCATFYTSRQSAWAYYGALNSPTAVSG